MWNVWNVGCSGMQDVWDVRCGMWDVYWDMKCWFTKCQIFNFFKVTQTWCEIINQWD